MNAFTKKISYYFSAHKIPLLVILLLLNAVLFYIAATSKVELFGKVEALGHRWATYTSLHKNNLGGRVIYSALNDGESELNAMEYQYKYDKSKGGDYIALGYDKPSTIRHSRAYYLDEQCMLIFSGRSEMTLMNMSLRCLY